MKQIIYPRISLGDISLLLGVSACAAAVAGGYGIIHDQITYSLAPEYFTKFKFEQFRRFDPGFGDRAFAGVIGFLATSWLGAIIGWILGRLSMRKPDRKPRPGAVLKSVGLILGASFAFGVVGFLYASATLDRISLSWLEWKLTHKISDIAAFRRVGIIHNLGYLGAVVGAIFSGIRLRRNSGS